MPMKRQRYDIKFGEGEEEVYKAVELARLGRGMTRKGFIMHAIANTYPELSELIVSWLMRYKNANRKAAKEDLNNN